ncbi:MAG: hypothetical protein OJF51_000380 [Nitrospira sp.]|nr:MAG: hypothetical protein OJF51_000380 [Nitrospira sp.]
MVDVSQLFKIGPDAMDLDSSSHSFHGFAHAARPLRNGTQHADSRSV